MPHNHTESPVKTLSRRTVLAGSAAMAIMGGAALGQTQLTPGQGRNPFPSSDVAIEGPEPLVTLLSYIPDTIATDSEGGWLPWSYADIAQQFEELGLIHDAEGSAFQKQNVSPALFSLTLDGSIFSSALDETFTAAIGFQPLGVDQALNAGNPPDQINLFRGNFDSEALRSAWNTSGYSEVSSANGLPVWTIGENAEMDLSHPIQRRVFAAFNNFAIVGDGILACTPTMALMNDVIQTFESGKGSVAHDPVFGAALRTLPDTVVSAVPVRSMTIELDQLTEQGQTVEDAVIPQIKGMLVGVEAGAVPRDFFEEGPDGTPVPAPPPEAGAGTALVRLITASETDANQALAAVEQRWTTMNSPFTGEPYTDLMTIEAMAVDGPVARFDFVMRNQPNTILNMVVQQDLLPFLPVSPED